MQGRGTWQGSVGHEDEVGKVIQEPVDAGQQVIPGANAAALDAPVMAADGSQLQGLASGIRRQCSRQVLPVSQDEGASSQGLLLAVLHAPAVDAAHHPDRTTVLRVLLPVGPQGLLLNIPDVQL